MLVRSASDSVRFEGCTHVTISLLTEALRLT
jgi:hypothetical protein